MHESIAEQILIPLDPHDEDSEIVVVLRVTGSPHLLTSLVHALDSLKVQLKTLVHASHSGVAIIMFGNGVGALVDALQKVGTELVDVNVEHDEPYLIRGTSKLHSHVQILPMRVSSGVLLHVGAEAVAVMVVHPGNVVNFSAT